MQPIPEIYVLQRTEANKFGKNTLFDLADQKQTQSKLKSKKLDCFYKTQF